MCKFHFLNIMSDEIPSQWCRDVAVTEFVKSSEQQRNWLDYSFYLVIVDA